MLRVQGWACGGQAADLEIGRRLIPLNPLPIRVLGQAPRGCWEEEAVGSQALLEEKGRAGADTAPKDRSPQVLCHLALTASVTVGIRMMGC